MKRIVPVTMLGLILLVGWSAVQAQTGYPMLMSIKPIAIQVGTTSEVTVNSRYSMHGTFQIMVTGEGVTAEAVLPAPPKDDKKKAEKKADAKPPNLTKLKVRFTATSDAKPGVRDIRLGTPQGASTIGQVVVVRDPVVAEVVKNDTAELAQEFTVPATLCGAIEKAEDVDFYKFKVAAGTSLSFHMRCQRLQDRVHDLQTHADPILTLRGPSGSTLAASDNHFFGDPFLSYKFEQAGEYMLEIRDVRYSGNQYWEYSIEISSRPFISQVFPMGVTRGQDVKLEMIGALLPADPFANLKVPADLATGQHWLQLPLGSDVSNPVPVVVTDLPHTVEVASENNEPAQGQLITVPSAVSGRIDSEGDLDCYTFEAKKSEKFIFEIIARRHQSDLDSHLRILNMEGKQLVENDDVRIGRRLFADSVVENWVAPSDGKFSIQIRDMHLRGGPGYVYFLKVTKSTPRFDLFADTDKTQLAPGSSGVFFVKIYRKYGFTGEVQLHVDGLPKGVTATCGKILADKGADGCIILKAAPGTPMLNKNIRIWGTSSYEDENKKNVDLLTYANIYQETYQPGGGRGHWPSPMHTVSIGAPLDIRSIKLSTHDLTLKPGESKKIEVDIERSPDYTGNVTLDVMFQHLGIFANTLPQGVSVDGKNSKTLLSGKESKGYITLKADEKAIPVEKQQIPVTANVSLNFVMKTTFSSDPVTVTVLKP